MLIALFAQQLLTWSSLGRRQPCLRPATLVTRSRALEPLYPFREPRCLFHTLSSAVVISRTLVRYLDATLMQTYREILLAAVCFVVLFQVIAGSCP